MKTKLLLVVALIALIAPGIAQELIQLTPAQERILRVEKKRQQAVGVLASALRDFYREATVKGKEQEFLDALGTKAASALASYAAAREFVLSQDPKAIVPAPDLTVFILKADGTAKYVAPPEPVPPAEPVMPKPAPLVPRAE